MWEMITDLELKKLEKRARKMWHAFLVSAIFMIPIVAMGWWIALSINGVIFIGLIIYQYILANKIDYFTENE